MIEENDANKVYHFYIFKINEEIVFVHHHSICSILKTIEKGANHKKTLVNRI